MVFDLVSRILFPTPASSYGPDSFPEQLIWVPRSLQRDGATPEACVPCLFLPYVSARFVVIYFHSNGEDLGRCRSFCSNLRAQFQVHVLAVEYPGYGICPGGPCDEAGATANALLALRFVIKVLQVPLDSIILLGRSIGSGLAISLALEYQDILGPLSMMVEERFPNKERVSLMQSPFLVVHGQKDAIVPCRHGIELYEICTSRKLLICPKDLDHNSNLLADISYLVLPMLQFFSLPDYCFDEMPIPAWLYDREMCPLAHDPGRRSGENPSSASTRPSTPAVDHDEEAILRVSERTPVTAGCRLFGLGYGYSESQQRSREGPGMSPWTWACSCHRMSLDEASEKPRDDLVLDAQPVLEPRRHAGNVVPQSDEVPMERNMISNGSGPLATIGKSNPGRRDFGRLINNGREQDGHWQRDPAHGSTLRGPRHEGALPKPSPAAAGGGECRPAPAVPPAGSTVATSMALVRQDGEESTLRELESRMDLLLDCKDVPHDQMHPAVSDIHNHVDQLMQLSNTNIGGEVVKEGTLT